MRTTLGVLALTVAACSPIEAHATFSADVSLTASDGTYAAMNEAPAVGGELRLANPIAATDDAGQPTEAIAFPLRHTDVHAHVAGMTAIYTVDQEFANPYDTPLEAVYVFPLGDEAAVSSYRIQIGERTIEGVIQTREQARKTYDDAKASGHTAALLEQDKPNVFEQRIANIAAHETIHIRFEYVDLLDYDDGKYTIAFPLVVGPRYLPPSAIGSHPVSARKDGDPARAGTTSIPYVDDTVADSTVSFTADIDAGVPIVDVSSPSHQIARDDHSSSRTTITLAKSDEIPNRDLVVRYQTAGDKTMVGFLTNRSGDDGTFVLEVQPKAEYHTGDITAREVILLIDTSGSMDGQPLAQAKATATAIVGSLTDRDTFDVLGFADGVQPMTEDPIAGDASGRRRGLEFIAALQSAGGTEMESGMLSSLATDPGDDRIRMVYMLSDGYVGNDDVIIGAAKGALGHNRIFPVGIGSAPNRSLMDQLGQVGRGFATYVNITEDAGPIAAALVRKSAYPYMTDITIDWKGLDVADVTPAQIPDVYAGQPLIVTGRYKKPGAAKIEVTATVAGKRTQIPLDVVLPVSSDLPPVGELWARRRIDELVAQGGQDDAITKLGLAYHLVTAFTSFVAVDRQRVVDGAGNAKTVEQPAAVPAGVNLDSAVGDSYQEASYSSSSGGDSDWGGGGGGGGDDWGGGGDVDWLTLALALALIPGAWILRRARA